MISMVLMTVRLLFWFFVTMFMLHFRLLFLLFLFLLMNMVMLMVIMLNRARLHNWYLSPQFLHQFFFLLLQVRPMFDLLLFGFLGIAFLFGTTSMLFLGNMLLLFVA